MEADPHAVARQMFGLVVRHLRGQAGLSLRELGKRCHYDYSRLSRMENGEHLPDPALIQAVDTALGGGGLLPALGAAAQPAAAVKPFDPGTAAGPRAMLHIGDSNPVILEMRLPDGRSLRVSISRRQFTQLIATGALRALLPAGVLNPDEADRLTRAIDQPERVDPAVIGYFQRLLAEHYTADTMLGPRQLLGPVTAQLDILTELHRHAHPSTAEPLLQVLAQYAEFSGWLHQDAGDLHAATYWSDRATQWAQSAGDQQMVAYLLVRKSNIACLAADPVSVVELAAAARTTPTVLEPTLAALAHQQEARGWALAGDPDQCAAHLDQAARLLAHQPDHDPDPGLPVYLHHYGPDTLEEQSASCYRAIGRADDAIAILERKINTMPAGQHRDRGHHMAKLANAVAASAHPEPERAARLGLDCLHIADQTGSARIRRELHTLDAALTAGWSDLPDTRALHDALLTTAN
jgi:hypothetical protein